MTVRPRETLSACHSYQKRTYRQLVRSGLATAQVTVQETDLSIHADCISVEEVKEALFAQRGYLEAYIRNHPQFVDSMSPLKDDPLAPLIVRRMIRAGRTAGVGPMAAVAGAISEQVGLQLCRTNDQVIVENGGDIFFKITKPITVAIYAGPSPLSLKVGLRLAPDETIQAVCTSSASVGHSISHGQADAVCILGDECALADAVATATGNRVGNAGDISTAIQWARRVEGVKGILIIVGDKLGAWGQVALVEL